MEKIYLILKNGVKMFVENDEVVLIAPYNKKFIERRKNEIPKGMFFSNGKWTCPLTEDNQLAIKFIQIVLETYNIDDKLEELVKFLPKVKSGKVFVQDQKIIFQTSSKFYSQQFNDEIKKAAHPNKPRWNDPVPHAWNITIKRGTEIEKINDLIDKWGFERDEHFNEQYKKIKEKLEAFKQKKAEQITLSKKTTLDMEFDYNIKEGLKLRPFQEVGLKFLMNAEGNCLLADDMGLGKTIQALMYVRQTQKFPVLVIVPSIAKTNWYRETIKWLDVDDEDVALIKGKNTKNDDFIELGKKVYVINYDIVDSRVKELMDVQFKQMIIDESHYIKNFKAKRTQSIIQLSRYIPSKILMTGTPILNRPKELWTTLEILKVTQKFGKNFIDYAMKYCDAHYEIFGGNRVLVSDGSSNADELQVNLRDGIMIRRLKQDVLKELQPKNRIIVPIDIDNRKQYERAEKNFEQWYLDKKGHQVDFKAKTIIQIEELKQLSCKGKLKLVKEFIINTYNNVGKIVVFAHHEDFIYQIEDYLQGTKDSSDGEPIKVFKIIGGQTEKVRYQNIDGFNQNKNAIIICSIKASGVAINLQTASTAIFLELLWTPADHKQSEDRIYRIGQENMVNIYYLTGDRTIEEWIWEKIQSKEKIIQEAIDGLGDDEEATGIAAEIEEYFEYKKKWQSGQD